ncbi:MAG: tripartite tricarboxylate transporter substrate binding protein [Acetobacteraceae bacterium]|nr:tripartite tricarboxylate transporter substrate binding protein [Acetobacteraceae bacterium]
MASAVGLIGRRSALAQEGFPNRSLRLIVAFPPGSINDVSARLIAPELSKHLGQPVVVENRSGAGGLVGTEALVRSPPDGHTIGIGTMSQLVMNLALHRNIPFDLENGVTPIGMISETPSVLVVHPSVPANTLAEFIAYARANPGKLNYGSAGNGSINHVGTEHFMALTGIRMTHIPYRGQAPAQNDLVAGKIDVAFDSGPACVAHIRAGRLRPLAVSFRRRSRQLPEVPLFAEAGLPEYANNSWNLLMAPSATPAPVLARLNAALNAALASPEMRARFEAGGSEVVTETTPEDAAAYVAAQRAKWVPIARGLGITFS